MLIHLDYGKSIRTVDVPDHNLLTILHPVNLTQTKLNGTEIVREALTNPINSLALAEIARNKNASTAVIVVNDITRPTPYEDILPPLLEELSKAGLEKHNTTLLIATGIHRPHTDAENVAIFGADICREYNIVNHDPDRNLKAIGTLSNGTVMEINRLAAEADLLITTGLVGLHYFAGYSGGRKSILPGIASRQLIEANHKMMDDPLACLGNYQTNPVSDLMLEAARLAEVDFIVNVVTETHTELVYAAAGDLYDAWKDAVAFAEKMSVLSIPEPADIVLASCGGFPKDINVYQAQKALDAAALAVKPNGTIILVAECSEGLGERTFEEWILQAGCPRDIEERFKTHFELGGHKAYAICKTLHQADIMLYSELPDDMTARLYMQPIHDLDAALSVLLEKYGPNSTVLVMPEAPKIAVKIAPGV